MSGMAAATAAIREAAADTGGGSDSRGTPAPPAANAVPVPVTRASRGGRQRRRSDQRWEVTEADLNMYGLIVGRPPTEAEKVAALTPVPNEATALRDAGAGQDGGGFPRRGRQASESGGTWSPAVMFAYLREVYSFSANLTQVRLTGPQVSAWVRQMSGEARRRLQETQARLAAPRTR